MGRGRKLSEALPLALWHQEKAGMPEEHWLPEFGGPDSKGNSNELALGKWGQGQVPPTVPFHLSLQPSQFTGPNCGNTIREFSSIYKFLQAFMWSQRGLARAFQLTQRKSKKMNYNHSIKPESRSTKPGRLPASYWIHYQEKNENPSSPPWISS